VVKGAVRATTCGGAADSVAANSCIGTTSARFTTTAADPRIAIGNRAAPATICTPTISGSAIDPGGSG
jgi:hypothetical protein